MRRSLTAALGEPTWKERPGTVGAELNELHLPGGVKAKAEGAVWGRPGHSGAGRGGRRWRVAGALQCRELETMSSGSSCSQTPSRAIPATRRVVLGDGVQLPPGDYSTTPGGTLFSTTPGGRLGLWSRVWAPGGPSGRVRKSLIGLHIPSRSLGASSRALSANCPISFLLQETVDCPPNTDKRDYRTATCQGMLFLVGNGGSFEQDRVGTGWPTDQGKAWAGVLMRWAYSFVTNAVCRAPFISRGLLVLRWTRALLPRLWAEGAS